MSLERWLGIEGNANLIFLSLSYLFLFLVLGLVYLDLRKAEKKMEAWLKLELPDLKGRPQRFTLKKEVVIGRSPTSDIFLSDRRVSLRHARIYLKNNHFYLEDLNSTNGTFVNGLPVKAPYCLEIGDKIKIGPYIFYFEARK